MAYRKEGLLQQGSLADQAALTFPLNPWKVRVARMFELANEGLTDERRRALQRPIELGREDDGWPFIESLASADEELRELRRWLIGLTRSRHGATMKLKKQVAGHLFGLYVHGIVLDFDARGGLVPLATLEAFAFRSFAPWYAMALLVMVQHGLDARVRRCELDECRRFFVDWPKKRGAPPQRFCKPKHAAIIRNRKWRRREREKLARQRRSQMQ